MNIFIRQNLGRGASFKNFISWAFESRLLCNLTVNVTNVKKPFKKNRHTR